MNQTIETLIALIRERGKHEKEWNISLGFDYASYNQDNKYFCEMKGFVPETDAMLLYRGTGMSFDEAFEELRKNVIFDKAVQGELG